MKTNLYDTMIALAEQLYAETQMLLVNKGLKANSDIVRSLEVRADADMIRLLSNDYLQYVSTGRKAYTKKIPIQYILEFIKKNQIRGGKAGKQYSDNQLAFAIQTSIYKRGIVGKDFMTDLLKMYEERSIEKISNDVEQEMLTSLDNLKLN
jgi:hypothetical protein